MIRKNNIFWNNLNYYLPDSPVETTSDGLGEIGGVTINFPTGIGIVMFGVQNWTVKNNNIFGHFKWGIGGFSDPFGNEGEDALSVGNQYLNNQMGRDGTDTNAVDFFLDGSGEGNCLQGNTSQTLDPSGTHPNSFLYPSCPAPPPPASGTGNDLRRRRPARRPRRLRALDPAREPAVLLDRAPAPGRSRTTSRTWSSPARTAPRDGRPGRGSPGPG